MVGKRNVDNIDNVRLEIISIQSPNKRFFTRDHKNPRYASVPQLPDDMFKSV